VALAISEAGDLAAAAVPLLRGVGRPMDWDFGGLWALDAGGEVLECLGTWSGERTPGRSFEERTRAQRFGPGEGIPGRVWAAHAPVWIEDLSTDPDFPRATAAATDGIRSAFAFPIVAPGGPVLGTVELFSRAPRAVEGDVVDFFGSVGAQIAHFVERRRAEVALRTSAE